MMRHSIFAISLTLLAGCEYSAPVDGPAVRNVISGSVVYGGGGPAATTMVLAFSAANPGPPSGTGSPVTFDSVGAQQFTGEAAGLQAGEFWLTNIPDGSYLLNVLMDVDGNFNPFVSVLAGATCGDWVGTHTADLASGTPATVTVEGGDWVKDVIAVLGLELTLQRPVFEIVTPTLEFGGVLTNQALPLFRLRASEVKTAFDEDLPLVLGPACQAAPSCTPSSPACPCEASSVTKCGTALWVRMNDADLDGVVDPYPSEVQASNGLLDIWPRVYLEYVGPGLESFEHEGRRLPERWVTEGFPMAAEIFVAAGAAAVPPGQAAAALGPVGTPFPAQELSVTFSPVFRHYHAEGTEGVSPSGPYDTVFPTAQDLAGVPTGSWSVTLVSFTGQTWKVPNEIAALGLPSLDPALSLDGQGVPLQLLP